MRPINNIKCLHVTYYPVSMLHSKAPQLMSQPELAPCKHLVNQWGGFKVSSHLLGLKFWMTCEMVAVDFMCS